MSFVKPLAPISIHRSMSSARVSKVTLYSLPNVNIQKFFTRAHTVQDAEIGGQPLVLPC